MVIRGGRGRRGDAYQTIDWAIREQLFFSIWCGDCKHHVAARPLRFAKEHSLALDAPLLHRSAATVPKLRVAQG
jgi:hypothetical protein